MGDGIFFEDVIISMRIGCSENERNQPQPVRVNVWMDYDCRTAGTSDHLKDALDYVKAYRILEEIVQTNSFVLLERFCELFAVALIQLGAQAVRVRASKEHCPISGLQGRIGVEIARSRDDAMA